MFLSGLIIIFIILITHYTVVNTHKLLYVLLFLANLLILKFIIFLQKTMKAKQPPIYTFPSLSETRNKIMIQKLPSLIINQTQNKVQCKDADDQPTIVRAQLPLSLENLVSYFQVILLEDDLEDTLNIGLTSKDNNMKQNLGKLANSLGVYKSDLFLNKKKIASNLHTEKLKIGDHIGIGINCHSKTFFITKNGTLLKENILIPDNWFDYYPAVGLGSDGQQVKFQFTSFKFQLHVYTHQIQKQIQNDIERQAVPTSQVYSLVHQYLSFNNYNQTLSLLLQKQQDYTHPPPLTRLNPKPNIPLNQPQEIQEQLIKQTYIQRSRIMSQQIDVQDSSRNLFSEMKRKNTEMMMEVQPDILRSQQKGKKEEMLSNLSQMSLFGDSDRLEEEFGRKPQRQMEMEMMEPHEKNQVNSFIYKERRQLFNLIIQKNIEKALKLLQQHIPKIFEFQPLLQIHMICHIFLRKVKQEGSISGLLYMRSHKEELNKQKTRLFPFFDTKLQAPNHIPIKKIYQTISITMQQAQQKQPSEMQDLLKDSQFCYFAQYVDSLILKNTGYLNQSRLTFMVKHMKKIQDKVKDIKGMNCGISINL